MSGFTSGTQQTIMPDSDKAFGRYMHKKTANEFYAGNGIFFPFTFFAVIFHVVCDHFFVYADDAMVTNGYPVGVFPKVVNNRLRTIKGFLAMGNPVLVKTKIQEFLERITVTVFFTASMKLKLFLFPEGFKFVQIFATKQL